MSVAAAVVVASLVLVAVVVLVVSSVSVAEVVVTVAAVEMMVVAVVPLLSRMPGSGLEQGERRLLLLLLEPEAETV